MAENDKVTTMQALTAFAMLPFAVAVSALGIMLMRRWFVVPLGAPAIGAAHAIGVYQ